MYASRAELSPYGDATEKFNRLYYRGLYRKAWSSIRGRGNHVLTLSVLEHKTRITSRHYAGIRLIPITQIVGSEGRCQDFDADFLPLSSHSRLRWAGIAAARSRDIPLPAVELVNYGDVYFVRDGHHRISVAKARGQLDSDANVTTWHCDSIPTELLEQRPINSKEAGWMSFSDFLKQSWRNVLNRLSIIGHKLTDREQPDSAAMLQVKIG